MRIHFLFISAFAVTLLGASCSAPKEEAPPAPQQEYKVVATIRDIMGSEVEPSAKYIWDSVGTEVAGNGAVSKAPKTDEDWKEERRTAITLVEAANLIVMPGRAVAGPGDKAANPGELSPDAIDALIKKDRATFVKMAWAFQEAAVKQLKVIEARNVPGLLDAGGEVDAACESCHLKYWYPNEAPATPAGTPPTDGKK